MGALARLYGGIEERLTAAEDLRSNGAGAHAMWRFVEDSGGDAAQLGPPPAGVHPDVVGGAGRGDDRLGRSRSSPAPRSSATGAITLGTGFLLFQYVLVIGRPLEDLVHQLETVQKANGAMVRVVDLLAVEPTVVDARHRRRRRRAPSAVDVSRRVVRLRRARTSRSCCRALDLDIAAGPLGRRRRAHRQRQDDVLAAAAAPGRADARARLSLGGVPIADIPLAELRRRVALVPQEVELFEGTIRDNVTLFDDAPTDAEVSRRAARGPGSAPLADGRHPPQPRRRRGRVVGRRVTAAGAGAGVAAPARPRRARRGDGAHRPDHRAAARGCGRPADRGADDVHHRPQAVDAADGRRGRSCSTTAGSSSTTTARCSPAPTRAAGATCSSWRWRSTSTWSRRWRGAAGDCA